MSNMMLFATIRAYFRPEAGDHLLLLPEVLPPDHIDDRLPGCPSPLRVCPAPLPSRCTSQVWKFSVVKPFHS